MQRMRRLSVAVGVLALVAAGCGSDDDDDASPETTVEETAEETAPPETSEETAAPETTVENTTRETKQPEPRSLSVAAQGSVMSIFVAEQAGFFEEEALDVEVIQIAQPAAQFAALVGGDVDIVNAPPGLVFQQNSTDSDNPVVYTSWNQGIDFTIVAATGSGIEAIDDVGFEAAVESLRDKTIGVPSAGGAFEIFIRQATNAVGLDLDNDVDIVVIGYGDAALTALETGVVDAYPLSAEFVASAESRGIGTGVMSTGDTNTFPDEVGLTGVMQAGFITTVSNFEEDPGAYAAFERALANARAFIADPANADELAEIAIANFNLDEDAAAAYVSGGLAPLIGDLNCDTVLDSFAKWQQYGLVTETVSDCDSVYRDPLVG